MQCSDLSREQRHPLLLADPHRFKELLITQAHIRLNHFVDLSEIRTEFRIVRGIQSIKNVLHKRLPYKILNNPRGQQIEAPLISDLVRPSRPFAVTGVEFAGPLRQSGEENAEGIHRPIHVCLQ